MPNPQQSEFIRVLEEASRQAQLWIENRSQVPVAPAAISVPDIAFPESGNPPEPNGKNGRRFGRRS